MLLFLEKKGKSELKDLDLRRFTSSKLLNPLLKTFILKPRSRKSRQSRIMIPASSACCGVWYILQVVNRLNQSMFSICRVWRSDCAGNEEILLLVCLVIKPRHADAPSQKHNATNTRRPAIIFRHLLWIICLSWAGTQKSRKAVFFFFFFFSFCLQEKRVNSFESRHRQN